MNSQPSSKTETVEKTLTYQERRAQIKTLLEKVGPWNLNIKLLSEKYKCSRPAIYLDVRRILERVDKNELKSVTLNLMLAYKAATKEAWWVLANSKDQVIRLKAADTLSKIGERFARFLGIIGPNVQIFEAQFNQQNIQNNITIDFEKEQKTVREAIKCIHEELLEEKSRLSPKEQD